MEKSEELQNLIDNNNVYFYDKIREDKRIVQFTESYEVAEQLGWADNYIAISETEEGYDGIYLKGYAVEKPLSITIDEKHAEFKNELKKRRESLKVSYNDDLFDANESAQNNMNTLIGLFNLGAKTVQIRSSNEVTRTLDQEQCTELSLIMVNAVQNLYSQYWNIKDALYKCKTLEEIEKLDW